MKLKIVEEFTLEVGEDTYIGTFADLTKKEEKEVTSSFSNQKKNIEQMNKLLKQQAKLIRKIDVAEKQDKWTKIEKLESEKDVIDAQIDTLTVTIDDETKIEDMFKKRLEFSLGGDDKDNILAVAAKYGYERVFHTILEDLKEKNEKN